VDHPNKDTNKASLSDNQVILTTTSGRNLERNHTLIDHGHQDTSQEDGDSRSHLQ
jgi:hypothetical protein